MTYHEEEVVSLEPEVQFSELFKLVYAGGSHSIFQFKNFENYGLIAKELGGRKKAIYWVRKANLATLKHPGDSYINNQRTRWIPLHLDEIEELLNILPEAESTVLLFHLNDVKKLNVGR